VPSASSAVSRSGLAAPGFRVATGDRTVIIAGGADAASQASLQVMSRFLNRLPTVTIREGHRVKVYLTSDLQLPAYQAREGDSIRAAAGGPMMRRILVGTLVLVLVTTPASAQFAVIDPANLAQAILIVQRTSASRGAPGAVPNDRADGARARTTGPVPDPAVCPHRTRLGALGVRAPVDQRSEQR
jgi:hypothetical protein